MQRSSIFLSMIPSVLLSLAISAPLAAQDYKFTIPTSQPWTDTGVDLQQHERDF